MTSSRRGGMAVAALVALALAACLGGARGRPVVQLSAQPRSSGVLGGSEVACDAVPALFVFGASYMDVGENFAAMPFRSPSDFAPYGIDFALGRATGRHSNGRLIIDHIAQGLGYEFMSPYLRDDGTFQQGVNFASSGATACNASVHGDGSSSAGLFSLSVQIDQFKVFLQESLAAYSLQRGKLETLPTPEAFSRGIYIFELGNNDYINVPVDKFEAKTHLILESIEHGLRILYNLGARTFVVMDAYPAGCLPCVLWNSTPEELDENGCILALGEAVDRHNRGLRAMVARLNAELPGARLVVFSLHEVFMSAVRNPSKFGLKHIHKSCCGSGGGLYNFDGKLRCGQKDVVNGVVRTTTVCENRSEYMMWDAVHPTDAFAFHIGQAFLSGEHMYPPFHIKEMCLRKDEKIDEHKGSFTT